MLQFDLLHLLIFCVGLNNTNYPMFNTQGLRNGLWSSIGAGWVVSPV